MKKVGIIGALQVEVELLQQAMEDCNVTEKAGMRFFDGILCEKPVTVVRSGAGKVNSAICAQILADCFDVTHMINTGIAGALSEEVDFCDVVVSTEVCYHDMHNEAFGYKPGEEPRDGLLLYGADAALVNCAEAACRKVLTDAEGSPKVFRGRIVTGDWFINNSKSKRKIIEKFGGLCTEMEGASIGHSAYLNGIPFVVIRSISDKADDSANMDYYSFETTAAYRSAEVVKEMLLADI